MLDTCNCTCSIIASTLRLIKVYLNLIEKRTDTQRFKRATMQKQGLQIFKEAPYSLYVTVCIRTLKLSFEFFFLL